MSQPWHKRQARCDCGALTLTAEAAPLHVHACTCTQCQRMSGGAMSWTAWFAQDAIRIEGATTRYQEPGKSSIHCFCPICGTGRHILGSAAIPNSIALAVGSFAEPDLCPPQFVLYWDDRPPWIDKDAALCAYAGGDD